MITTTDNGELEAVVRLSKDLKKAVASMTPHEVRFLVDAYYQMQENRKRADNQRGATEKDGEPHEVLDWLFDQNRFLENQLKSALNVYSESHPVGQWLMSLVGIGPVISAGLLAHFDIKKAPTYGHFWY